MRNGIVALAEPARFGMPFGPWILGRFALFFVFGAAVQWCGPALAGTLVVEKGVIRSDTTWEGNVLIKGDVEIAKGVTLTVLPGTVVKFARIEADGPANFKIKAHLFPRAELTVMGKILAQGSKGKEIVFTSAEKSPHPGDWGAINLLDTKGSIIEFCEISYADTGVHCHGSQFTVANCYLHDNGTAIAQKDAKEFETKCFVPILYNRVTGNGGGILFGDSTSPTISHNQISQNKFFGIFGKKGGLATITYNNIVNNGKGVILYAMDRLRLSENNISGNDDYNLSLLENQVHDIDGRRNWWGTTDERRIGQLIWDKGDDAALGRLDFSEFAKAPIVGAGIP